MHLRASWPGPAEDGNCATHGDPEFIWAGSEGQSRLDFATVSREHLGHRPGEIRREMVR